MEKIRAISQATINRIRNYPENSGIAYKQYGEHSDIREYNDREITEMVHGVYKDSNTVLADGDYFINLNLVVQTICVLADATYYKNPTSDDLKSNHHNNIKNIRTFYVKDYFLITQNEIAGTTRHKITKLLCNLGAINAGRGKFEGLYSNRNVYRTFQDYKEGLFPKDLYHPIKKYINGLFFNDDYRISNFIVESTFKIEKSHF